MRCNRAKASAAFIAESGANQVRVLRVGSGSGTPARNEVFASGSYQPYGIAFYPSGSNPEWVYVANSDWTRDIAFTPDGKRLLLTVGSGSNIALDMFPAPRVDNCLLSSGA